VIKICVWTRDMTSKVTLARWTQSSGPLCLWQCFQKSSWQRSDNSICYWKFGTLYIVLISLQLLVILKLSKLFKGCDTKRLLKHRCLQICVQADIFKYSNLIKTKKIIKTKNQKTFYIFDQILLAEEKENFWVLFLSQY